eukprot:480144-Rhodomonas_salina.1
MGQGRPPKGVDAPHLASKLQKTMMNFFLTHVALKAPIFGPPTQAQAAQKSASTTPVKLSFNEKSAAETLFAFAEQPTTVVDLDS